MQKQKKILFLHGFYASGSCVPALALKEAFIGRAQVLTPDLPLHPADAVRLIREICDREKPAATPQRQNSSRPGTVRLSRS